MGRFKLSFGAIPRFLGGSWPFGPLPTDSAGDAALWGISGGLSATFLFISERIDRFGNADACERTTTGAICVDVIEESTVARLARRAR